MNDITRVWRHRSHTVVLRHYPLTNAKTVTVDGVEVVGNRASAAARIEGLENNSTVEFEVNGVRGRITIKFPTQSFTSLLATKYLGLGCPSYACFVLEEESGREIELVENNNLPQAASTTRLTELVAKLVVDDVIIDGDKVVWYRVTWPPRDVSIHRRYRDFYTLYSQACSALRGTHLYTSVPEPPPKESAFVDHYANEFIQQRRSGLEAFLRKLLLLPSLSQGRNPDVQEFLGIVSSGVRETSVAFFEGKLGIRLQKPVTAGGAPSTFSCQVGDVTMARPGEEKLQGELCGRLRAGDMITRVGGESALLSDYAQVVKRMSSLPRPMVVHFLTTSSSQGEGEDGEEEEEEKEEEEIVRNQTGASSRKR